jgi:hypothetical protein
VQRYFQVALLRIQAKGLELPAPFRWSVTQPLDVDAPGQTALDSGADKLGGNEGKRDRHVDMTHTASLARRNLLNVCDGS